MDVLPEGRAKKEGKTLLPSIHNKCERGSTIHNMILYTLVTYRNMNTNQQAFC
jgi:hypothetical protein